ncbi:superoxide dismutase [Cryptosporidium andersoni]|uniref:Superoxide dismutase n=1 Tax=Cryptosporidium andersoni TaxID=117008 RepID=A0A1J4MU74_9CRYT|nr:superoxide dismutase [Cryptosporidium andersoni]
MYSMLFIKPPIIILLWANFSTMVFELPPLPYPKTALLPAISSETLDYHYGKHHAGYINKLNVLIKGTEFENSKNLIDIIMKSTGVIYNNAAQAWNHTFYWECLRSPSKDNKPINCTLINKIQEAFGSFMKFKEVFSAAATSHFGSGWVWLVLQSNSELAVVQTHDGDNPYRLNLGEPILVCDIWEHAYYIDYRNNRNDYVENFFELINWDFVADRLKESLN